MSDSSNSFWQALPALKERQRRTGLLAALVLGLAVLVLVDGLQALMRAGSYHLAPSASTSRATATCWSP